MEQFPSKRKVLWFSIPPACCHGDWTSSRIQCHIDWSGYFAHGAIITSPHYVDKVAAPYKWPFKVMKVAESFYLLLLLIMFGIPVLYRCFPTSCGYTGDKEVHRNHKNGRVALLPEWGCWTSTKFILVHSLQIWVEESLQFLFRGKA